jgi:glyoxylase-like metal-dependent hydrolase (beta-lactamase superfamily II)
MPRHSFAAHVVALLALVTATAQAQPRTADPAVRGIPLSAFPRLVPLAPGVYGYEEIRAPGFTTVSLVVIGDSGVLIADGQGSVPATQRMLDEIAAVTSRPVRWYVVGSDHGDHTAGNAALPAALTWVVHPTSRAQLVRDSSAAAAAHQRASADSAAIGRPAPAARVVVVPPSAMRADRQTIDVGGRLVEVHFLGRAHTGGDLMVRLPREKLLFMSEAYLNRVFPAMRSAYPTEWVQVLDRALAMDVERYVPGHGFIETPAVSREELIAFRDALRAVIGEVRRLHARGLSVEAAIAQADWGAYRDWFLAEQQGAIAVRRVYEELEGRLR